MHPRAYERWTSSEDDQLKLKYQEDVSISELASYFQREPSAIRLRLTKLGLLPAQDEADQK